MLVVICNNEEFDGLTYEGSSSECVESIKSLVKNELAGQRFDAEFYDGTTASAQYTVQFYPTGVTLTHIHA